MLHGAARVAPTTCSVTPVMVARRTPGRRPWSGQRAQNSNQVHDHHMPCHAGHAVNLLTPVSGLKRVCLDQAAHAKLLMSYMLRSAYHLVPLRPGGLAQSLAMRRSPVYHPPQRP